MSVYTAKLAQFFNFYLIASSLLFIHLSCEANDAFIWQHHQLTSQPSLRGSAISGDTLWVTGTDNTVFTSVDGGKSWQDRSVKTIQATDFRDIAVFDAKTAIVMGVGNGQNSALYLTENAGETWQLLHQNQAAEGFYDSIAFWDRENGLLLGDPVDGFYVIERTVDGGKTWQRIEKNKLPEPLTSEAAFAASGNTLIVGENGQAWFTTGGWSASLYYSADFGKSWQRFDVPIFKNSATAGGYGLARNQLGDIFVLGGDYLKRDGRYTNMAKWSNGQFYSVPSGDFGLRTAMGCSHKICISTGKLANDISYDQGLSWQGLLNTHKEGDAGFYTLAQQHGLFLFAGANGHIAVLKSH